MSNIIKSIKNNIPNAVTCINLLCGTLAIVAAFNCFDDVLWGLQGYQLAFLLIAIGAVADFCDGLVARLLHAVSGIGKELDSLSDLVTFGLAPAMIIYNMMHIANPDSYWCFTAMLLPVFGALRLAKFNVDTEQTTTFKGLPIPANALYWIGAAEFLANSPEVLQGGIVGMILLFSILMVSDIPMFSFKLHGFSLRENWAQFLLIIIAVILLAVYRLEGLMFIIWAYILLSILKDLINNVKSLKKE
ncbi:MAG: CDP-diacylglycerol--serine O-phosphatidyltransferase [Muribaculaceae bacterium]|nr:CDP-diacylglycerol--serine O-phosphatidyltransferase [Muribaculaceae bacterium]